MLKLILIAIVVTIIIRAPWRVRDLLDAAKNAPKRFRAGKRAAEDPASAAKRIDKPDGG